MNPPKCSDDDYINFVITSPRSVSATEAAKVQGDGEQAPAHDAFTRLLHRLEPDTETLWREAESQVNLSQGILVIDDSTQGLRPTPTNKVEMSDLERVKWASFAWAIENYHCGIKQFCLIERAQEGRSRRAWRNHIGLCLRAFLRLESHCHHRGISWDEAKTSIMREAVRAYIAHPRYSLIPTA